MEWQDVAAALNRLGRPQAERDLLREQRQMLAQGVPPELVGRAASAVLMPWNGGQLEQPGVEGELTFEASPLLADLRYEHVKGDVHPYFHRQPGPIGGQQ
jgi:hypothetical protein